MAHSISDSQILDAALEVIIERGYTGATTREIALKAGINEVTLFRRFGSKAKLMEAVVEQRAKGFDAAGIEYTGDLEADLVRIVQFYQGLMQSHGRVITMLINEVPRQPELLSVMQTPLTIFGKIAGLLERYQAENVLISEAPMQALLTLVAPIFLGSLVQYLQPNLAAAPLNPSEQVRNYLHGRAVRPLQ
jgi:AcrR family transcriptional regulator